MQQVKVAIVGEAYGENEEKQQTPFVGAAGYELTRMLAEAGIHRADCLLTNVFNIRPKANKVEWFCGDKREALSGYPALVKGKHVRKEFAGELARLRDELVAAQPNIIIALGNTAMWALLGKTAITKLRGTTELSTHCATGFKVLPTYHPAAVLRQWELRPVAVIDLVKARRESEYPDLRRPRREIWIEPTVEDLYEFDRRHLHDAARVSVDIETSGNQITCVGFAPSPSTALVIPIITQRSKNRSYWPDVATEKAVWLFIKEVLERKHLHKTFQNGMYDIAFLWRAYGVRVFGADEDTMLLHHALQPESLKGLGFLGSVYANEGSWKGMREKSTTIKADE